MRRYRVLLAIEVGGKRYEFGEKIELDLETAKEYSHALVMCEEAKENPSGGNE